MAREPVALNQTSAWDEVDALENQDTTALIVALLAGALGAFIVSWCLRWPKKRNGVDENCGFFLEGEGSWWSPSEESCFFPWLVFGGMVFLLVGCDRTICWENRRWS